jgi:hypothetical protein
VAAGVLITSSTAFSHASVDGPERVWHDPGGRCIIGRLGISERLWDQRLYAKTHRAESFPPTGHEAECGKYEDVPDGDLKIVAELWHRDYHIDDGEVVWYWFKCKTYGPHHNEGTKQGIVAKYYWDKHYDEMPCGAGYYRMRGYVGWFWNDEWHGGWQRTKRHWFNHFTEDN